MTGIGADVGEVVWRRGVVDPNSAHLAISGQSYHTEPVLSPPPGYIPLSPVRWVLSVCAEPVHATTEAPNTLDRCSTCRTWLVEHGPGQGATVLPFPPAGHRTRG